MVALVVHAAYAAIDGRPFPELITLLTSFAFLSAAVKLVKADLAEGNGSVEG